MSPRRRTRKLTRRQALVIAAGGIAPLSGTLAADAAGAAADQPIITRPIPTTGERLPVVGLGTDIQWFADTPERHATFNAVLRTLIAGGGSVVDTAGNSGNRGGYGMAEDLLGEALADRTLRQRVFVATKVEQMIVQIGQGSMQDAQQRLGIGQIDLVQLHSVNARGTSIASLRDWKARGLVRYIGITTDNSVYFDAVEEIMRREKPDFVELNCSIRNRKAEQRLLPLAAELGIATLIDLPFGGTNSGRNLFGLVQGKPLPEWAADFDATTWAQFFLKYLLGNSAVTTVIPGTDKPEHVTDNIGAGRGRLPTAAQHQQMAQFIDAMS